MAAVKYLISILFEENHRIVWLTAAPHEHGNIFHRKTDCWCQTHARTFGVGLNYCFWLLPGRRKPYSYGTGPKKNYRLRASFSATN